MCKLKLLILLSVLVAGAFPLFASDDPPRRRASGEIRSNMPSSASSSRTSSSSQSNLNPLLFRPDDSSPNSSQTIMRIPLPGYTLDPSRSHEVKIPGGIPSQSDNSSASTVKYVDIEVSGISPFVTLEIWDYAQEDDDQVRVEIDGGDPQIITIKHAPTVIQVPIIFTDKKTSTLYIAPHKDGGGGGVTYAYKISEAGLNLDQSGQQRTTAGVTYRFTRKCDFWNNCTNFIGDTWDAIFGGDDKWTPNLIKEDQTPLRKNINDLLRSAKTKSGDPLFPDNYKYNFSVFRGIPPGRNADAGYASKDNGEYKKGLYLSEEDYDALLSGKKLNAKQQDNIIHEMAHAFHDKYVEEHEIKYEDVEKQRAVSEGFAVLLSTMYSGADANVAQFVGAYSSLWGLSGEGYRECIKDYLNIAIETKKVDSKTASVFKEIQDYLPDATASYVFLFLSWKNDSDVKIDKALAKIKPGDLIKSL